LRIVVFLTTSILQVAAAVFGLLILLVGLNGYSERHATPSLIFYVVFCLVSALALGFGGSVASRSFVDRKWLGSVGAALVAIVSASLIGVVLVTTGVFATFFIAEFLRRAS
jgi:hypothetical protein